MSDSQRTTDQSPAEGGEDGGPARAQDDARARATGEPRAQAAGGRALKRNGRTRTATPPAEPATAPVIPLHPDGNGNGAGEGRRLRRGKGGPPARPRVKIKKLRVLALLGGLGVLAAVSTVFGMMMAVASDLPSLEDPPVVNSRLVDRNGAPLGLLTGSENRIFVKNNQIAPVMKHAIIAIEDQRFYTHDGVDLRGVARALYQDVLNKKAVQGGSTIAQQFVKNATAAQGERTLFNKLREAALAYHLTRRWSRERILRNYLNTIYFGNGAYGIESAARTYFGTIHNCGGGGRPLCAPRLEPHEAALLAGIVASPSAFDPIAHPHAAKLRRDLVLRNMVEQHYLSEGQFVLAEREALPTRYDVRPPREDTKYPYFTSWVKQQVVDRLGGGQFGARQAFEGGLTVKTTLDLPLQEAADAAIKQWLPNPAGPRAAMVVIDNPTGEVRAMVGGDDYQTRPFNLATQGQRQPGSAFKPFVLAEALRRGISPSSAWASKKLTLTVPGTNGREHFVVNNYENNYSGVSTLARATTFSDNSVYAQVGIKVGTKRIARLARRMGIRTPVSRNWAIALGGLKQGVTPLDMAHAYQTFATGGRLVFGTLSPEGSGGAVPGPVAIKEIQRRDGDDLETVKLPNGDDARNHVRSRRVLRPGIAEQVSALLASVVRVGTARRAALGQEFAAGKTGTTENYGDAWFVGWTRRYTVAVWVGYPDRLKPMKSEFQGEPVAGGTYPAAIWKSFMEAALKIDAARIKKPKKDGSDDEEQVAIPAVPAPPASTPAPAPSATKRSDGGSKKSKTEETAPGTDQGAPPEQQPAAPQPEAPAAESPAAPANPGETGGGAAPTEGAVAPAPP